MAKKLGRKVIAFLVVVTVAQIYTFQHYNSILSGDSGITAPPKATQETAQTAEKLRAEYPLCAVSEDGTMAAYVDGQNQLNVFNLTTNQRISTVKNDYPVQYVKWIMDDNVFVGEVESPGNLLLKTVDASGTGMQHVIHTFTGLGASDVFKAIAYSLSTNDTYILLGSDVGSLVYHFDTNNDLSTIDLGGRLIKNIAVTTTGNTLYFEDYAEGSFNVLSYTNGSTQLLERNAALITVVDNTLYYGQINSTGYVTAVYQFTSTGGSSLVKKLPSPTLASQIDVEDDGTVTVGEVSTFASTATPGTTNSTVNTTGASNDASNAITNGT
jgi:hypothetical protein